MPKYKTRDEWTFFTNVHTRPITEARERRAKTQAERSRRETAALAALLCKAAGVPVDKHDLEGKTQSQLNIIVQHAQAVIDARG